MRFSVIEGGKVVNHAEAEEDFAVAQGWVAAGNSRVGDTWDGSQYLPPVVDVDALRQVKKDRLNQIHDAKLKGSIMVSGMQISLDTDSKAIFALAKTNSRASRKIYTKAGDRAILTAAQFDALVATIENYGQDLMNKAYDTSEALDAAETEEGLDAIDVEAGWPS